MKYRVRSYNTKGTLKEINTGKAKVEVFLEGLPSPNEEGLFKQLIVSLTLNKAGVPILDIRGSGHFRINIQQKEEPLSLVVNND